MGPGGDANPFLGPLFSIVVDGANLRALVTDAQFSQSDPGAVLAVDLMTGARTILSDEASPGPFISIPLGIAVDTGRALVTDAKRDALVAVALTDGAVSDISDTSTPDEVNTLGFPGDIALDGANGRALLLDWGPQSVIAMDLATGARTILSDSEAGMNGGDANPFSECAIHRAGQR